MSMPVHHTRPELLAPAGSLESFFAAMEKGADAVYAGLRDFSARAKAKNFTTYQLERMVAHAHSLERRVLVTLNTLVKEGELAQLADTLAALEAMGADGIIVQDLAVARLAKDYFPSLPVHASTQMTVHNAAGVRQLAEMGFHRVVLARELHLDEIRDIITSSPIEVECFIHGALCFSLSGQCYFSSFLGGHSGNRGRCTQPCRRLYRYRGKEGYWFSTNDFTSIDLVRDLARMGVASLKIEGRMKSAEYVASVVEAYRTVLDAPEDGVAAALVRAKELLRLSFGRVPTRGFLVSRDPHDISTPSLKGATGRFLGEIKSVRGSAITFETRDRLHVGDRVRVQPKSDMAGRAFTIKELFLGRQAVKVARERSLVTVPAPFVFTVGDTVFKVSSETAFTLSESACQRRLESVRPGQLPCRLHLFLADELLTVVARAGGEEETCIFPLGPLEPARTSDMAEILRGQFGRSGDTPFRLAALEAPGFPRVLIPPARLKEVRRLLFARLAATLLPRVQQKRREAHAAALASLSWPEAAVAPSREELLVKVPAIRDLAVLAAEGVDGAIVPLGKSVLHQLAAVSRRGADTRLVWSLPFVIFDDEWPWYRDAVQQLHQRGFRRFELNNMAHFQLFQGLECRLSAGYRLFTLNRLALEGWQELGCTAVTLYIEDDRENMAALLAVPSTVLRRAILYAPVPVITSRITIRGVKSDLPLQSDRGEGYRVSHRDGLSHVVAERRFAITQQRQFLREAGCRSFLVDLTADPPRDWGRILDACRRGIPLEGTSEFNFTAGLV
jgi:putative protease